MLLGHGFASIDIKLCNHQALLHQKFQPNNGLIGFPSLSAWIIQIEAQIAQPAIRQIFYVI